MIVPSHVVVEECTYLLKIYIAQYIGAANQLAFFQETFKEVSSYLEEVPQKQSIIDRHICKPYLKIAKKIMLRMKYLCIIIAEISKKLKKCLEILIY